MEITMQRVLYLLLTLILASSLWAMPLAEGFEGDVFPPLGWTVYNGGDAKAWYRSHEFPRTGSAHARIDYGATAHDDWLITPQLSPSLANHHISFWIRNQDGYYLDSFNVKLSTSTNQIASFTVNLASGVIPDYRYEQYSYDLGEWIGSQVYIAIQATSANQWALFVDDFAGPELSTALPGAPSLQTPAGSDNFVSLHPMFEWSAGSGGRPSGYKLYLDTMNPPTTMVAELQASSYVLPNALQEGQRYYWAVKAYNSSGESPMSNVFSFNTMESEYSSIGLHEGSSTAPLWGGFWFHSFCGALSSKPGERPWHPR